MKSKFCRIITLLLLAILPAACSGSDDTVKIATKPMTEQFILGEMLAVLIEQETDYKVELTHGVGGGTAHIHPAVVSGEFDLYPEYTGTAWAYVLKKDDFPPDEVLYAQLQGEYRDKYGLEWIGLYGFNNTYGLAVRQNLAQTYKLETFSDLAEHSPDLNFGAEYDFYEREDGFEALSRAYGYDFKSHADLDIGLKYQAIKDGSVDVINIFTTDGQVADSSITVLEDDRQFYRSYFCGTVVRAETLERLPQLKPVLEKMNHILNNATMALLNHAVDVAGRDPKFVARQFLAENGFLVNTELDEEEDVAQDKP